MYIIVEIDVKDGVRYVCGRCKVELKTPDDEVCKICDAIFTAVHSRIIGEAKKYANQRKDELAILTILDDPIELIGS